MKALKNIIITHVVMLVLFAGAAMALAQEASTSSVPTPEERQARQESRETEMEERGEQLEERRMEAEANMEERREEMETKREEVQANIAERRAGLQERAQTRITNLAANMSNRMEAVITRIQNISDRIGTRIEKLKEQGVNTEAAEAALASAQISIDAAATEITNIDDAVASAVGSEDVRTSWIEVRVIYTSIKNHILTARAELRAAILELKTAVAEYQDGNNGVNEAVQSENVDI